MRKVQVQYVEEPHVQRRYGTTQDLSIVCRFLDFMITDFLVRDLTVKNLGAGLMLLVIYLLLL